LASKVEKLAKRSKQIVKLNFSQGIKNAEFYVDFKNNQKYCQKLSHKYYLKK
jgi:hypothetical protein